LNRRNPFWQLQNLRKSSALNDRDRELQAQQTDRDSVVRLPISQLLQKNCNCGGGLERRLVAYEGIPKVFQCRPNVAATLNHHESTLLPCFTVRKRPSSNTERVAEVVESLLQILVPQLSFPQQTADFFKLPHFYRS
jgi:hypothetical protein